jgi:hypothetical protein
VDSGRSRGRGRSRYFVPATAVVLTELGGYVLLVANQSVQVFGTDSRHYGQAGVTQTACES